MEVFDFAKVSHEDWVKVDSDEALFRKLGFLANEEELVELVLGVLFDTTLPLIDLGRVELVEVLAKRVVELVDVLVLFAVLKGLREALQALHWILDTLE